MIQRLGEVVASDALIAELFLLHGLGDFRLNLGGIHSRLFIYAPQLIKNKTKSM
jgi:hypothetical protein